MFTVGISSGPTHHGFIPSELTHARRTSLSISQYPIAIPPQYLPISGIAYTWRIGSTCSPECGADVTHTWDYSTCSGAFSVCAGSVTSPVIYSGSGTQCVGVLAWNLVDPSVSVYYCSDPTGALDAWITGPSHITTPGYYTWTAHVNGNTDLHPYTVAWAGPATYGDASTPSTIYVDCSTSGTMQVLLTLTSGGYSKTVGRFVDWDWNDCSH
jgi:hypothetical protein